LSHVFPSSIVFSTHFHSLYKFSEIITEIENQKKKNAAQYWAGFPARDLALLAWPSGTVAQPAHASWCGACAPGMVTLRWPRVQPHGGVAGQGSSAAPVQRGRRCEHEDGEGRSPGKKDGGAAHQGWRDGVSLRAAALQ
jgi:hypothetical protein